MASKYPRNLGNVFCKVVISVLIVAVIFGALYGISFLANKGYSPESLAYGDYVETNKDEFVAVQDAAVKAREAGKVAYPKQIKVSNEITFSVINKEKCPVKPSVQVHGTDYVKYTCDKLEDISSLNIEAYSNFDGKIFKKFQEEVFGDNDFTNIPVEGEAWYKDAVSYFRYKEDGQQSKTKYEGMRILPYLFDYAMSLTYLDLGYAIDNMFSVPIHQQFRIDKSDNNYYKLKLFCAKDHDAVAITVVFTKSFQFKVAILEQSTGVMCSGGELMSASIRSVIEANDSKFQTEPKDVDNYIPAN